MGFTVRLESRVSSRTRIEVVTEGVLIRRLQRDPSLPGVAAVILDEFHERSLDADLSLAFSQQVQALLRPELRLVVMSATLGAFLAKGCSELLGGAPVVVRTPWQSDSCSAVPHTDTGVVISLPHVCLSTLRLSFPYTRPGARPPTPQVSEGRSFPVDMKYVGEPGRNRGDLEVPRTSLAPQVTRLQPCTLRSVPALSTCFDARMCQLIPFLLPPPSSLSPSPGEDPQYGRDGSG